MLFFSMLFFLILKVPRITFGNSQAPREMPKSMSNPPEAGMTALQIDENMFDAGKKCDIRKCMIFKINLRVFLIISKV